MIQSTQAGGGLFVTHWNMQSLMQLLTEADDEMVSSGEDEDVAPNERPLWIEGRGLIMFGQLIQSIQNKFQNLIYKY